MAQIITILSGGVPSPQGVIVPANTPIQFYNQSGQTVSITFNPNPNSGSSTLFQNVGNLTNGSYSSVLTPSSANGATNYNVIVSGGGSVGPYAIQEGSGYMIVLVTNNDAEPDPIAIPYGGNLQILSSNMNQYNLGWGVVNPFGAGNMGQTSSNVYGAQILYFGYSLSAQAKPGGEVGGGKVIIRS